MTGPHNHWILVKLFPTSTQSGPTYYPSALQHPGQVPELHTHPETTLYFSANPAPICISFDVTMPERFCWHLLQGSLGYPWPEIPLPSALTTLSWLPHQWYSLRTETLIMSLAQSRHKINLPGCPCVKLQTIILYRSIKLYSLTCGRAQQKLF